MKLTTDVFLERAAHWPVLDVRSPREYTAGHLPGAHCFPLFDDRERAQVGTTYKQIGAHEALLVGLELVGPKMRSLVEQARHLAPTKEVLVHCWRGGMRSESVAWLLATAGFTAHTLEGGYKAYRNHALESFRKIPQLVALGGATGSGKTAVLRALQARGEQVINLEALAHHRGSAFGGIGQTPQPTTEQFQNDLHHVWQQLDPRVRVWIEDESFSIGQVKLPIELWNAMRARPLVLLEVPRAARIQRLVQEYGSLDRLELERAVVTIQKRLGGTAHPTDAGRPRLRTVCRGRRSSLSLLRQKLRPMPKEIASRSGCSRIHLSRRRRPKCGSDSGSGQRFFNRRNQGYFPRL